jgi:hypothetical protein
MNLTDNTIKNPHSTNSFIASDNSKIPTISDQASRNQSRRTEELDRIKGR